MRRQLEILEIFPGAGGTMWCKNQVLAALCWPDRKLNTLELKTLEGRSAQL